MSLSNLSKELIKAIDIVIEVAESRLPVTSRHHLLSREFKHKLNYVVFTKADLADINVASRLIDNNENHFFISTKHSKNKKKLIDKILSDGRVLFEKSANKGIRQNTLKILVVGIPNVGKSSLINWLTGHSKAKVANVPGVTRAPQWIRIHPKLELLDTPGIFKHFKFNQSNTFKLALAKLINAYNIDELEIAQWALDYCKTYYPKQLSEYAKFEDIESIDLDFLAKKHNFIKQGNIFDTKRSAKSVIKDFESGKIGKFCLDIDVLKQHE